MSPPSRSATKDEEGGTHTPGAHFGPDNHIIWHQDSHEDLFLGQPRKLSDLIRAPTVRQWLHQGKIHREKFERQQSRFELFFDLVFVAFAHHLSDVAAETPNGASLLRFVLTFYPAWSLWAEFRTFMNQSGTDDLVTRLSVLYLMAILVGYSANASAIDLTHHAAETAEAAAETVASNVTEAVGHLVRRAAEAATTEEHPDGFKALVASTAFFIAGRGLRLPMIAWYAWHLPHFAMAFLVQGALHLTVLLLVMPCLWITDPATIIALVSLCIFVDVTGRFLPALFLFITRHLRANQRKKRDAENADESGDKVFYNTDRHIPAINIEHHSERTLSFVVIVLGEIVISVVYHVTSASVGLSLVYCRAVLGLIVAFFVATIYFDVAASGMSVHALRRHWISAVLWDQLHWPFSCALILCGAAISRLVVTEDQQAVPSGIRWFFSAGLGVAMLALAAMGAAHRNLEPTGLTRLNRLILLGSRALVGIILVLLPIANSKHLSSTEILGVATALTGSVVLIEIYGKLHSPQALLLASSESIASTSGTLADDKHDGHLTSRPTSPSAAPLPEEAAAALALADDDCVCRTWCEWVEMEKARKAERRRVAKEAKAAKQTAKDDKQARRWAMLQKQKQEEDPLACACAGG